MNTIDYITLNPVTSEYVKVYTDEKIAKEEAKKLGYRLYRREHFGPGYDKKYLIQGH
jgi:hypothetical protein